MIYLDNAATTQIHPEVLAAMNAAQTETFANPGSIHAAGWEARQLVDKARAQVARVVNASPQNIVFTSGGSEANALALLGVADRLKKTGKTHILINETEHKSVLNCGAWLSELGFDVEYLPVSGSGRVLTATVKRMLREDTGLVSVMFVNNETGVVNEIEQIAGLCHENGVLFHTDCVQAFGKWTIDVEQDPIDFLSVSAHKLQGPKGVGCLYVRERSLLKPLIPGGSQEYGLRAGTENVPGIVGFGKAAKLTMGDSLDGIRDYGVGVKNIIDGVLNRLPDIARLNGDPAIYGTICNFRFDGVHGESLVLLLSSRGVMVSAGSACTSNSAKPSHVLKAMGLTDEEARSSVRISVFEPLSEREERQAADAIAEAVTELRKAARYQEK